MPKFFLCLAILASLTGCRRESAAKLSERFPFAYVRNDCGPTDGLDLVFYFTTKEGKEENVEEPHITIQIAESAKSAPHDYSIQPRSIAMLASRCMSAGHCVSAASGTLHLTKFSERNGASGVYELHFQDGSFETASFDATWRAVKQILCG